MPQSFLLYDGDCPACRAYVGIARLRDLWPDLRIIDARQAPELVAEVRAKGFEVNEGFLLSLGGKIHFGAEATRVIGEAGARHRGSLRALPLTAIGTAPWSRGLYPLLNRGRQLLLAALGRPPIP